MVDVVFDLAEKEDISELIGLRIAYMMEDYGTVHEDELLAMEAQLPGYYERRLGKELIAFVARYNGRIVATVYLLIIEKPANPSFLSGLTGEVLNVYTEKEFRGQGISTRLMKNMIEYAKEKQVCRIYLKATEDGYLLYKRLGFEDKNQKYKEMQMVL